MPEYKLLQGTYRLRSGEKLTPGDTTVLTEERVERSPPDRWQKIDDEVEASGDVPDDWETLRQMGVVYEGDEVTGATSRDELESFFESLSETEVAAVKTKARQRMAEVSS